MGLGRGKLHEAISVRRLHPSQAINSPTIYYNGGPFTTTANLIDCANYDDAIISLNFGTITGPSATVYNNIIESDSNDPTTYNVVNSFTTVVQSTAATLQLAFIRTAARKRFLGLKTEVQGALATVPFAAKMILGKPDTQPGPDVLIIDL